MTEQKATDIYEITNELMTKVKKLNIHSVMQAEWSDGAKEAAVGQRSVGKKRAGGVKKCTCKTLLQWISCDERCDRN